MLAYPRSFKVMGGFIFVLASILTSICIAPQLNALSYNNISISLDTGSYSTTSYPRDTVTVNVQIQPEVSDLYKSIAIVPIISKSEPSLASNEYGWADDTDATSQYQVFTPTTTNTVTFSFEQQLITRGANYIGCVAVREDYDNANEETGTFCYNAEPVVYTGTLLPVWRFYSSNYKSHFYTISHAEKTSIVNNDSNWRYEKPSYKAHIAQSGQSGNIALYRFWSKTKKSHFYTSNAQERDQVIRNYSDDVWKYEKIAYYVQPYKNSACPVGTSPIFRFWSKTNQSHFYTKSVSERNEVIQKYSDDVWRYEGPKFCAW